MAINVLENRRRMIAAQPHKETESGGIVSFSADNTLSLAGCKARIESVQTGNGDPSPENVRPITGWTGAKVTRTGKNLLNLVKSEMYSNGYNRWFPFKIKAGTYTMSCQNKMYISGELKNARISVADANRQSIKNISNSYGYGNGLMSFSFTITEDESRFIEWLEFEPTASGITFAEIAAMNNMVELGSTATAYEPYHGETYDITFPSEAGTVYGGTLDVTTGVLTVDMAMVDLGELAYWSKDTNRPGVFYSSASARLRKTKGFCACSEYKWRNEGVPSPGNLSLADNTISLYPSYGAGYIFVVDIAKAELTAEQFKTVMSGIQLVYELATPVTYHLTPQEITTLIGANNIWADTGDITVTRWTH